MLNMSLPLFILRQLIHRLLRILSMPIYHWYPCWNEMPCLEGRALDRSCLRGLDIEQHDRKRGSFRANRVSSRVNIWPRTLRSRASRPDVGMPGWIHGEFKSGVQCALTSTAIRIAITRWTDTISQANRRGLWIPELSGWHAGRIEKMYVVWIPHGDSRCEDGAGFGLDNVYPSWSRIVLWQGESMQVSSLALQGIEHVQWRMQLFYPLQYHISLS